MMLHMSRTNWFVRWAFLLQEPPGLTSICALFWRGFVMVPLALTVSGFLVALLVTQFYMYATDTIVWVATTLLTVVGVLSVLVFAIMNADYFNGTLQSDGAAVRVVTIPARFVKAVKNRWCPLVVLR